MSSIGDDELFAKCFLEKRAHIGPTFFVSRFVISDGKAELFAEFVGLGDREAMNRSGIVDELVFPAVFVECFSEFLDRFRFDKRIVGSIANEDCRFN